MLFVRCNSITSSHQIQKWPVPAYTWLQVIELYENEPDQPAATITTASGHLGSHRTIHPSENRVLSPQECANLQTFPPNFDWGDALEKWGHTNIRIMIGEAVPPLFTKQHGHVLRKLLSGKRPRRLLAQSDRRCKTACKKLGLTN